MFYFIWLSLGILATLPLLAYGHKQNLSRLKHLMGRCLLIAAVIYVGFAAWWGDTQWQLIEASGIVIYGLFYWLAARSSLLWLALGWLLHPVWDIALHGLGPGSHIAPDWYVVACIGFDSVVAGYLVWRHKTL